jgi:hypothetical protein
MKESDLHLPTLSCPIFLIFFSPFIKICTGAQGGTQEERDASAKALMSEFLAARRTELKAFCFCIVDIK